MINENDNRYFLGEKKLKDFFDSIYNENNDTDILSPPPGIDSNDAIGAYKLVDYCPDCAIIELRTFHFLQSNIVNDSYDFLNKTKNNIKIFNVIFKDTSAHIKSFADE